MSRLPRGLFVGFIALLLNSAYLAAFADPSLWYYANVALHPILGPVPFFAAGVALGGGLVLGVLILIVGATRSHAVLVYAHVIASALGAAVLAAYIWRKVSLEAPGRVAWTVRVSLAAVLAAAIGATFQWAVRDTRWRQAYRIVNPTVVAVSMNEEGRGPTSPFFPSSADTSVRGIIPANFFLTSQTCGRCHRDIYEQWSSSAHHFSSFNNQWYRKSVEYLQDVAGIQPSKWCAGCHDHAVFFNGRFDRPIKEQIDTPEAQAGLA